jgi:hypothetical protein
MNRKAERIDVALIIERFLERNTLYPQEWNDFVDTAQRNSEIEHYRRRCDELDPLVNRPGVPDPEALFELREMIKTLRQAE